MLKHLLLIFFVFGFVLNSTYSQGKELEYLNRLSISEGLAHNGVTSILQDSKGYLWIATYDGLNKYDGYSCKVYKNNLEKKLFVSNRIRTIFEDDNGTLWLGTDQGISVYNPDKEEYHTIYSNQSAGERINGPIVRKFFVSKKQGLVFCATEGDGILVFNNDFEFLKKYPAPFMKNGKPVLFMDGFAPDETNLFLSSSVGLIHFNTQTGSYNLPFENDTFSSKAILQVDDTTFLMARDWGIGVYSFTPKDDGYLVVKKHQTMMQQQFSSAAIDKLGNLWLGTLQRGIIHISNANSFVTNKPFKQSFFRGKSGFLRTSCFLATRDYGCWMGSFDNGIYQFDLEENPFKYINCDMKLEHGLVTNEILHLASVDNKRVYISANNGGSALFNTETKQFEPLPFKIPSNQFLSAGLVFIDSRKNTWIRVAGQLGMIKTGSGEKTFKPVSSLKFPEISEVNPRRIAEDKQGNIWLGCTNDLYKVNLDKNGDIAQVESLNNHPYFKANPFGLVRFIYVDPLYDFIWVGTDSDGLIRITTRALKPLDEWEVTRYLHDNKNKLSLSSNFVSSIIRVPNSELWIGTERGGINKVNNSDTEPEFITFSEKNGLSNNVVKNILYDDAYNLWISTNKGLNKFDTKDFKFRTFGKQDGLPFEDFLYPAQKLKNGNFIFSGLQGFFFFNPNKVRNEEVLPRLNFGGISIFHKPILPGDTLNNRILFQNQLADGGELVLKHNENVFSIELNSLHFSTPENHFVRYQLLPFNEEWIEVLSNQNKIYYNGLPPGEYVLKVMASNSLNEWTKPIVLKITIKPPFWVTVPALVLYLLVLVLVVYSVMYYILSINKLKHKLEIEQLEKDKVKEVNAAKLNFFSNISHEIKTPITLITGPVNILAERFKANHDVLEKLQIVQRQSKKILGLVNQVHDFQRADANQLKMNYSRFCINDMIQELVDDFSFKASNDKKLLTVNSPNAQIIVSADRDKLEKILNNLLNNAFKFTKPGDTISIKFTNNNNELEVQVIDSGQGIDPEDLPYIFDRFYQSKKKSSEYTGGSGIGLAFARRLVEMHYGYITASSAPDKGSTFTIKLPIVSNDASDLLDENEAEILKDEKNFDVHEMTTKRIVPEDIRIDQEFANAKIFFAEDNTDMRTFISGILANFFDVKSFLNGKECLVALEEEWPDIVISDVLMPEMNGFDLCKRIKSDIRTSHIPVILLTACSTIEDKLTGLEVGADAYINKPFNVQHLITRTETLLKNRKKLRERYQLNFPLVLDKTKDNNNELAFLEKLYALLEENLDNQNLDLDWLAKQLYLNRTHFYQKVKALTNQTPFELLKSYRLKKAAEMLAQKKLTVNEVYMLTGFKSRTHFSKLFKENYHVTPGKFAAEISKKNGE